jgi:hypothetical protein
MPKSLKTGTTGSDHMSSVPFDVVDRAIETTEQPRDRRRLYGNGLQSHACGSSGTTNEVVADLVLQLLHFLVAEEYEDGRSSSTLLIYFASVLGISTDGLTFERPPNYTPKLYGLIRCARLVPLEISLSRFRHPIPYFTTTPGKHINQSFLPSSCQLSLAVEFVIHCFQSLPRMPAKQNTSENPWSLHPSRHGDVRCLLQDSGLSFDFYDIDDPFKCTREHDTNVMGRFPCWNTRCFRKDG